LHNAAAAPSRSGGAIEERVDIVYRTPWTRGARRHTDTLPCEGLLGRDVRYPPREGTREETREDTREDTRGDTREETREDAGEDTREDAGEETREDAGEETLRSTGA
jgi:hypothetical protein